jgi:hypothetical protein
MGDSWSKPPDHSLVSIDGTKIKPTDVDVGDRLLHSTSLPKPTNFDMGITEIDAYDMGTFTNSLDNLVVPDSILHSPYNIRNSFFRGYLNNFDTLSFCNRSKKGITSLFILITSIGYTVTIDVEDDIFHLNLANPFQEQEVSCDDFQIKKKFPLEHTRPQMVYDIEIADGFPHHVNAQPGKLIVHNTDSVMVQFPAPKERDLSSDSEDEPLDLRMRRYFFQVAEECADRCSKLYPPPNCLEFETCKFPFLLCSTKKNYAYREFEAGDPVNDKGIHMKGLPIVKRDRCPMVRRIGKHILDLIMNHKQDEIEDYLKTELTKIVMNKLPYSEFTISCALKDPSSYKSTTQIQLTTAERIRQRSGKYLPPGSRLAYVVIAGEGKQYQRGEDPEYAESKQIPLDYDFYLDSQLYNPLVTLLQHHPQVRLKRVFDDAHAMLRRRINGVHSIANFFQSRS